MSGGTTRRLARRGPEEMAEMMLWYGGAGLAWWQASLMWIAMVVFWAALIWLVYALLTGTLRHSEGAGRDGRPSGDAYRILDERLARGEIDAEEYRWLCDVLRGGSGHGAAGGGDREGDSAGIVRDKFPE